MSLRELKIGALGRRARRDPWRLDYKLTLGRENDLAITI